MADILDFQFCNPSIDDWLKDICYLREIDLKHIDRVNLSFDGIEATSLMPEHIASFACLLESWFKTGFRELYIDRDTSAGDYLWDSIRLQNYWAGQQNYAASESSNVLNLWRIVDEEKEIHGRRVSEYLKNSYFSHKDLSAVENSLTEAFYNIFDHADAKGNAFTMLQFDEVQSVLHVAVCDFGIGIAKSVRNFLGRDIDDKDALNKAIEANFTVGSASYNAGQGLSNIIDSCTEEDTVCIYSNAAGLSIKGKERHVYDLGFCFVGTLLFYSMSISHFEEEETLAEFEW